MLNSDLDQEYLKDISISIPVKFQDVKEFYSYESDLVICYNLNGYRPRQGDRIGIYKLGWSYVKDYVLFDWQSPDNSDNSQTIIFPKSSLPLNTTELYQVCYINGDNQLLGASTPFQFTSAKAINCVKPNISSGILLSNSELNERRKDLEIRKLKEENAILKESLKMSFEQKYLPVNNNDSSLNELRHLIGNVENKLVKLADKIKMIESTIKKEKLIKSDKKLSVNILPSGDVNECNIEDLPELPPFPFQK